MDDVPARPRFTERTAPLTAMVTALATFACCVPLGLVGALSVVVVSTLFEAVQPWLPTTAAVLLTLGALQAYRGQKTCRTKVSRFTVVVLGLSAVVTLSVLLFPQTVAGLLADYVM